MNMDKTNIRETNEIWVAPIIFAAANGIVAGVNELITGVRDFRWWYHWECCHYAVGIFFADAWNQKCSHAAARTTAKWMSELKALHWSVKLRGEMMSAHTTITTIFKMQIKWTYLKTIASFGFLSNYIQYRINQFGTFGIMAFGPIVAGSRLAKYKIIRSIQLTVKTRSHRVHCAGLQIDQYRTWYIFATTRLIVIHVDAFQLQFGIAIIGAGCIDGMFIWDYL